jgi:hypothetical protein
VGFGLLKVCLGPKTLQKQTILEAGQGLLSGNMVLAAVLKLINRFSFREIYI